MKALGSFLLLVVALAAAPRDTVLWYAQPAAKWTEALPIGGGRLGAMVFGGTAEERVQFNEDTLWRGRPHDYVRAGAKENYAELKRLLLAGQSKEAEKLARDTFIGDPKRQMPYQPFGDVRLSFPGHAGATDYRRELDLAGATEQVFRQAQHNRPRHAGHRGDIGTRDQFGHLFRRRCLADPFRNAAEHGLIVDFLEGVAAQRCAVHPVLR